MHRIVVCDVATAILCGVATSLSPRSNLALEARGSCDNIPHRISPAARKCGKDRAVAHLALGANSVGAVNPDVFSNDPLICALALLEFEVLLQLRYGSADSQRA